MKSNSSLNTRPRNRVLRFLTPLVAAFMLFLLVPATASAQSDAVSVSFTGLEPLGGGLVYEGWLIIDGSPVTSGTFNIDANGNVAPIQQVDIDGAERATAYVLTIEPANDADPAPADTHILGGEFSGNTATLTLDHFQAIGTNFSDAAGSYIIKTPTTATTDDELSGVWFLDPSGPAASLSLPELPKGWTYEGWAVVNGTPLSTGTFLTAAGADNFSGFSGPDAGPPFPGEDFVTNAPSGLSFPTDLTGATIAISVEPSPDDSPAPFALKPLISTVVDGVEVGAPQPLGPGPTGVTGIATLTGTGAGTDAQPQELAFTGAESWYLAALGALLVLGGAGFVMTSRKFQATNA